MKTYLTRCTPLFVVLAIFLLSGCASIVSKSIYPISISSTPSGADISVLNSKGAEVYSGKTPSIFKLKAGEGFFKKASYTATFTMDGYDKKTVPIEFKMDGWYVGNLLFGGLIGMLIVDPATGAMWKLDTEFLNETLSPGIVNLSEPSLRMYSIHEIPSHWRDNLVKLPNR